jgi:hypothetical protein
MYYDLAKIHSMLGMPPGTTAGVSKTLQGIGDGG